MQPWVHLVVALLMLSGMLFGLLGLVVPAFPGITVIWGLALLYGVLFGFKALGGWLFAVITVLAVIGWVADNLLMGGKARESGARWSSIMLAFAIGFIASLVLTPLGGIAATLLTLFLAENAHRHNREEAWEVTKSMIWGWGWAVLARMAIGMVMILVWAVWAWA